MKNTIKTKKPMNVYLKIILIELLLIFFYTANGAYVSIAQPEGPVLQFALLIPLAIGLIIYVLRNNRWRDLYLDSKLTARPQDSLLYAPLLIVLAIIFISNDGLNLTSIPNLLLMLIMQIFVVGLIEEIMFRGIMLKALESKGVTVAVLVSSVLFGVTHALQLIGGQSLEDTILQIIYAFVLGAVLALLVLHKHTLMATIVFHGVHNFLNFMAKTERAASILDYVIVAILIVYMIWLFIKLRRTRSVA
ncbi:CAAX amino terminal protease self- immunity [compost metagenome]